MPETTDNFRNHSQPHPARRKHPQGRVIRVQRTRQPLKTRNPRKITMLAALMGLLGLMGIGHMCQGRTQRGVGIMLAGWGIIAAGMTLYFSGQMTLPLTAADAGNSNLVLSLALPAVIIALYLGQILDATRWATRWNRNLASLDDETPATPRRVDSNIGRLSYTPL